MFEFELVDKKGNIMDRTPEVNFDAHSAGKPGERVGLRLRVR